MFLGFYPSISHIESTVLSQLIVFLSSIGFAPVNSLLLSGVLKIGWLLAITRFKLFEIVGLFIYILTFPIWAPIFGLYAIFSSAKPTDSTTATPAAQGLLKQRKSPSKLFTICCSLLLGWFLLYGNANTTRQITPGVFLAGAFLVLLTYRLFLRVKPENDVNVNVPPFGWLGKLSLVAADVQKQRLTKEYTKKSDVQTDSKVVNFTRKLFVRITMFLRGRTAEERISLYVLAEYLFSLIIVAASAILFWALMIKAFYLTSSSLSVCLHFSVSHFVPGIDSPTLEGDLPMWTSLGPAATAWILFVLYIGPASSLLPERQRATIKGLERVRRLYRQSVNVLMKERVRLREIESKLET